MTKTLLIKSKTPKVYKNKKLNNATFMGLNLNEYQVFLYLVSKIGKVDNSGKYIQPECLSRIYTLTAKEFSEVFNIELKHSYTVIKKAIKKLMTTSITLEQAELFELWEINICSMAKYNHKNGSIVIEFTDSIMPYLSQVKQKFVLYNLKEVANFGSLYTTRLYELIQEFKDTGFLVKSVEQLREIFAVGKNYSLYADFKRKTFGHAVAEINSQYEMDLTFIELKEGRKVVAIRFEFKKTHIRKAIDLETGNERNIYIKPKQKKPKPKEKKETQKNQAELF